MLQQLLPFMQLIYTMEKYLRCELFLCKKLSKSCFFETKRPIIKWSDTFLVHEYYELIPEYSTEVREDTILYHKTIQLMSHWTRPWSSFFGKISFEFLVQCICSVAVIHIEKYCTCLKPSLFKGTHTQDWEFFWLLYWKLRYFFVSYA